RKLGKTGGLARTRKPLLSELQLLLRSDLAIDIKANDIPLPDCAASIPHRRSARFNPAVFAVRASQAVPASIGLASCQRMRVICPDARQIVGMNARLEGALQPRCAPRVQIVEPIPKI